MRCSARPVSVTSSGCGRAEQCARVQVRGLARMAGAYMRPRLVVALPQLLLGRISATSLEVLDADATFIVMLACLLQPRSDERVERPRAQRGRNGRCPVRENGLDAGGHREGARRRRGRGRSTRRDPDRALAPDLGTTSGAARHLPDRRSTPPRCYLRRRPAT